MAKSKKVPKTPDEALRDLLPLIAYAEASAPWDSGEFCRKALVDAGIVLRDLGVEIKTYREYQEASS